MGLGKAANSVDECAKAVKLAQPSVRSLAVCVSQPQACASLSFGKKRGAHLCGSVHPLLLLSKQVPSCLPPCQAGPVVRV